MKLANITSTSIRAMVIAAPLAFACAAVTAEPMQIDVEMRDGTALSTFVYLPEGEGPFPTLVARTIYGPPIIPIGGELYDANMQLSDYQPDVGEDVENDEEAIAAGWPLITQNGYALVIQNTRGRNGSEGVDRSWLDDGADGYDLVEWVNVQPWSNGRIGLFGDSAVGISAALAAAEQPPSLDALFLQASTGDPFGTDMAPSDGALRTESLLVQGGFLAFDVSESHFAGRGITGEEVQEYLPVVGGYLQGLLEGLGDPLSSDQWMAMPLAEVNELDRLMPFWAILRDEAAMAEIKAETSVLGDINVPTSVVTLWQDTFFEGNMALYADLEERDIPRELLIVNGTHYEIDDPRIFPEPRMLSWFDHWLKDEARPDRPTVVTAVQEADGFTSGEMLADLTGATERMYFAGDALAAEAMDSAAPFVSDPANPVPTQGGRYLLAASGGLDQTDLIARDDTVTFASAAFDTDRVLSGQVTGQISAESTAPSFDLSVRLLDVAPDGTAHLIISDHVRVEAATPGTEVVIPFDMSMMRHNVAAGHHLAVMVAGSDFPAWDRNPQTGDSIFETAELQAAEITVIGAESGGSYIDLPFASAGQ